MKSTIILNYAGINCFCTLCFTIVLFVWLGKFLLAKSAALSSIYSKDSQPSTKCPPGRTSVTRNQDHRMNMNDFLVKRLSFVVVISR